MAVDPSLNVRNKVVSGEGLSLQKYDSDLLECYITFLEREMT